MTKIKTVVSNEGLPTIATPQSLADSKNGGLTKKEILLKMFDEAYWLPTTDGKRCKVLTNKDFKANGLDGSIEYQVKYCDVIYARNIFNKMGYRVCIGGVFGIYER